MYYQNVRGLRTKTVQFYNDVIINDYEVIIITETWLSEGILSEELFLLATSSTGETGTRVQQVKQGEEVC